MLAELAGSRGRDVELAAGTDEVAAFAEAVAHRGGPHARPRPSRGGRARCRTTAAPALSDALAAMGWLDLADDPALLAARRARPRSSSAAGSRRWPTSTRCWAGARWPAASSATARAAPSTPTATIHVVVASEPVAYGDALGVHRVLASSPDGRGGRDRARRVDRREHRLPRRA